MKRCLLCAGMGWRSLHAFDCASNYALKCDCTVDVVQCEICKGTGDPVARPTQNAEARA